MYQLWCQTPLYQLWCCVALEQDRDGNLLFIFNFLIFNENRFQMRMAWRVQEAVDTVICLYCIATWRIVLCITRVPAVD